MSVRGEVLGFLLKNLAIALGFLNKTICNHPEDCHRLLEPDNHCVELCGKRHCHTRAEQLHTHQPLLMCS